jgi:hypothetical protein
VMKSHDTPGSDGRSGQAPTRKPYQKPQLHVYGDLSEITQTVAGSKDRDGGGHPNKHFTS